MKLLCKLRLCAYPPYGMYLTQPPAPSGGGGAVMKVNNFYIQCGLNSPSLGGGWGVGLE